MQDIHTVAGLLARRSDCKRLPENLSDVMLAPFKGDSQLRDSRGFTPLTLLIGLQRAQTTVFASAKVRQTNEMAKALSAFFIVLLKKNNAM